MITKGCHDVILSLCETWCNIILWQIFQARLGYARGINMNTSKLTGSQIVKLYDKLVLIAKSADNIDRGKEDEESEVKIIFSLSSSTGKQLYKSLTDEQLLQVITDIANEIGHSPSQKEVFWVWREYIKLRFKKWPYALTAAGLSKKAGKGGLSLEQAQTTKENYNQMINSIREKAKVIGRIPHPKDLPEIYRELGKYMHSWQEAVKDAELDQNFFVRNSLFKIPDLEEEYRQYLREILTLAEQLKRAPIRNEINLEIKEKLLKRCGTWRNILYQIGLEPVIRMTPFSSTGIQEPGNGIKRVHRNTLYDCHYKILYPDLQTQKDLMYIKAIFKKLHHLPQKNDISHEIRVRLMKTCGSWSNALYQLKFIEKE